MHPHTQTRGGLPHFLNAVIKCQHGGHFIDFNKWTEAILFAHRGGPQGWRANIPGVGLVPPKGQPGHDPVAHMEMRKQVWHAAMGPDVEMPEEISNMDELLFVPPSEVAILIITCWNDLVDDKYSHGVCGDWKDCKEHTKGLFFPGSSRR